jgi:hypothetical protein
LKESTVKEFPVSLTHASGAGMRLDPSRLLVAFKDRHDRKSAASVLRGLDLVLEDAEEDQRDVVPYLKERTGAEARRRPAPVNHTDQRYWARTRSGRAITPEQWTTIRSALRPHVDWLGPVYRIADGSPGDDRSQLLCPLPHALVVRPTLHPQDRRNGKSLTSALSRYGLKEVAEKTRYLAPFRYCVVQEPEKGTSYEIRERLIADDELVADVQFEHMPLLRPTAAVPSDTLYANQWNMERIGLGGAGTTGWDLSTGVNAVVICVLDEGCDLTHPDLQSQFSESGINLGTMLPDGSPTGSHGTACAGIAAASFDNGVGVAGAAGNCRIMPLAFSAWTDVEVAAGINYAADNGARVISMSFGWNAWSHAIIDPAIQHAFDSDVVMCVATHNHNGAITYPATNPLVMACGASDQVDDRKSPSSPDGEFWGSNFGPATSVVAPGVLIPTTDRQGALGYGTGDYVLDFNGTSAATPHVAGLAGLLRSLYPALTNVQVRNIIERTAEKVGSVPYATTAGYPNGTWNQEMGYGRINALRALDYSDVMIRDWTGDTGVEPSTPPGGDFWNYSDIAVRIFDDDVFQPQDPSQSRNVERGQTNYLYVRVTNNGPRVARNVVVNARITPWVGLQFVYPQDWALIDAMHVSPTPITASFATIGRGASVIAKFSISATQVEELWGWVDGQSWHPCLLASANADNDYAFGGGASTEPSLSMRRNNLAQRNLSVINVIAGATASMPMLAGSRFSSEREIELVIDRSRAPQGTRVLLGLDEDVKAFPRVDLGLPAEVDGQGGQGGHGGHGRNVVTFLEKSRVETTVGGLRGVLELPAGTRFEWGHRAECVGKVSVTGGEIVLRGERRFVDVRDKVAIVRLERAPNQMVPLALRTSVPAGLAADDEVLITVTQRGEGRQVVGGASVLYRVRAAAPLAEPLLVRIPARARAGLPAPTAEPIAAPLPARTSAAKGRARAKLGSSSRK